MTLSKPASRAYPASCPSDWQATPRSTHQADAPQHQTAPADTAPLPSSASQPVSAQRRAKSAGRMDSTAVPNQPALHCRKARRTRAKTHPMRQRSRQPFAGQAQRHTNRHKVSRSVGATPATQGQPYSPMDRPKPRPKRPSLLSAPLYPVARPPYG